MSKSIFLFLYLFVGLIPTAQAYIDPGTGSLIWQFLVAVFFGMLFNLRRFKNWLLGLKIKNKSKD